MELPRNELRSLFVEIEGRRTDLEVDGMFNPNFNNELRREQFRVEQVPEGHMLYAFFADGAGTYTAHWRIVDGRAERLVLSNNEEDFLWQQKP
jgi:hypothetical protein